MTIVEVNSAALAITNAELQYRNAVYDYLAARPTWKVLDYDITIANQGIINNRYR